MKIQIRTFFIALLIVCLGLAPLAQAVNPPPDGGYPGFNTAEGQNALFSLTTGIWNTAIGAYSLFSDNTGSANTAVGTNALRFNTTGIENTANGVSALYSNTTGSLNTANGYQALIRNTIGTHNTANGVQALHDNYDGTFNTAIGAHALYYNYSGTNNTAVGRLALYNNTFGLSNTALGASALQSNRTGHSNTALGNSTLVSNETGNRNTALGASAGTGITGNGNVCIGWAVFGAAGESDTTRIRNIGNTPLAAGATVLVDAVGGTKLGYLSSSRRNKDDIKPMDNASEAIYCLRPVSFRYKPDIDPTGVQQYGLIAENVEEVNPNLVVRDKEGKAATLRFEAVNAMLLNEFLKEHRKVEELKATIAKQEALNALQQKQIEALTVGLQKVSAQIEAGKFATGRIRRGGLAPQMVVNNE